jgi:peptidoglycan/LPS O-acetylase OafA/YrhL
LVTLRFLWGLLAFEVVAFACRWWAIQSGVQADPSVYVTPYLRPESILLGLALAVVKPTWKPRWSILAAVIATLIYISLPLRDELIRYFPAAVVVTGLVDGGLRAGPLRAFLAWRPIRSLGIISYGLYVFHIAAIWTVVTVLHLPGLTFLWQGPVIMLLSLSLTIVAAAVSYRFLERPFLRLKLRFTAIDGRGPEGQPLVEGPESPEPGALETQRPHA